MQKAILGYGKTSAGAYRPLLVDNLGRLIVDQAAPTSLPPVPLELIPLNGLSDVDVVTQPALDGQALTYDAASRSWHAGERSAACVGDIRHSILTEPQFELALPPYERGKWALADGRNIHGSDLSQITGQDTVPDLRAAFLRMAGVNAAQAGWNGGFLHTYEEDTTRRARGTTLKGQANAGGGHGHISNASGTHYHSLGHYDQEPNDFIQQYHNFTAANPSPGMTGKKKGEDQNMAGSAEGTANELEAATSTDGSHDHNLSDAPNHTHVVEITGGGDYETRPKNYCVNYFVKISG